MPRKSGTPKTGGRKKGTRNKKTAQQVAAIEATGVTPLEYMLEIMRNESVDAVLRADMAKAAAPYVHPKLSSIEGNFDVTLHKHEDALDELE